MGKDCYTSQVNLILLIQSFWVVQWLIEKGIIPFTRCANQVLASSQLSEFGWNFIFTRVK